MKNALVQFVFGGLFLLLIIGCNEDENIEKDKIYGVQGVHQVSTFTGAIDAFTTVYYPSDIATMENKVPVVFFISGWFGTPGTSSKYETLLQFVASQGVAIIYTDEGSTTDVQHSIKAFEAMLDNSEDMFKSGVAPFLDLSKIGVVGHSAGGGIAFTILDYFSDNNNYGENGRFVMGLDPWFAFEMSEDDMKTLPANTNAVTIRFGEGGNNGADGTDARIPLTQYYLLSSIADKKKDYQIYAEENADHGYCKGSKAIEEMQGVLKPLDALMAYTFDNTTESIRVIALENGNDDPYGNGNGIQHVRPKDDYSYPCDGANTKIDYCKMFP